jgi:cellulose synthase/poly-beta-1,6-N-acetylglucosamine synthase-like glycosyltransferase
VHRQTWSQALTDAIWHSPFFRIAAVAVVLAVIPVLAALVLAYVRQRRGRTGQMLAQPPGGADRVRNFTVSGRRLLMIVFLAFSCGSVYGIWTIFYKSWWWRPWLAVLAVMIPWMAYTMVIAVRRPVVTAVTHSAQLAGNRTTASIDVFIAYAGEDPVILANTLAHVRRLDWDGHVHIYLLDDSKRPSGTLREMAARHGAFYLRRRNRGEFKKAGNLNYALSQSVSPYIAVFDADFVPVPAFLRETIPYFADRGTGIVQTAQFFDTSRAGTQNWMARLSGIVQGMFFRWQQPGQDSLDSAMCVGTNVVYRRAALEKAGGFARISGGEDIITGVELLAAGYRTIYVPLNLAEGLCPSSFPSTINQQYRWALTTFAMTFPVRGIERVCGTFWHCPMSLRQRLVFMSGLLYYAQSALALVITVMPSLVMLWQFPFEIGPGNYLPILPSMLGMALLPFMLPGWRLEMLRLALVYSVAHLLAIIDAATGQVAPWVPTGTTGKAKTPRQAAVILRTWIVVTQSLSWIAIARDLPVYGLPAYWPVISLTALQTIIFFPLLLPGYGTEPLFRRYVARHLHRGQARLRA